MGATGIEPVTSAVSRQRSAAELSARDEGDCIAHLRLRCLHAGDPIGSNGGTVWRARQQIESVAGSKPSVALAGMEGNRPAQAEQDLVEFVPVLGVVVAGLVRPGVRLEPFDREGSHGDGGGVHG